MENDGLVFELYKERRYLTAKALCRHCEVDPLLEEAINSAVEKQKKDVKRAIVYFSTMSFVVWGMIWLLNS